MIPPTTLSRATRRAWCLARLTAVVLIGACGGGGDGGGSTGPGGGGGSPGFTIAASSSALTVARGASGTITFTVSRTGGFTGAVSLQPTGMPAGVTALFSVPSVASGATTSTLTITATNSATAGTTTLTVVGNGASVANQTVAIQLTVTVPVTAGPFAMTLSVASYVAQPPATLSSQPVLTITRNSGFTGVVTTSVTGLPPGLAVGVTPTSVTGNTASVVIIDGGVAKGTYPVTLHGVGGGGEQSLTFNVVVVAPSTGAITWQMCDNAARIPIWFFAVKDGSGPWTRVVPNGNSYAFTVTSPTAQVAMVTTDSGGFRTTVYQYTQQEVVARAAAECANYPGTSTRTVTGQVTGLLSTDLAFTTMGGQHAGTLGLSAYNLTNLPAGPLDLVSVRGALNAQADFIPSRLVVRRALDPAPGGQNAAVDFGAAEAVAPATATWTFTNTNGEGFSLSEYFRTAGNTPALMLPIPGIDRTTTSRTIYSVPAGLTIAGDLHQVIATVRTTDQLIRATRQIIAYGRTLGDRTVSFGPALPTPSVTAIAGTPGGRLRIQGTLPTEYNAGVSFDLTQTTIARFATLHATRGFLGAGSAYDLQMPDLSAALGWDTNFATRAGVASNYWVSGGGPALDTYDVRYLFNATRVRWTGALTGITPPADGAVYLIGRVAGNVTP